MSNAIIFGSSRQIPANNVKRSKWYFSGLTQIEIAEASAHPRPIKARIDAIVRLRILKGRHDRRSDRERALRAQLPLPRHRLEATMRSDGEVRQLVVRRRRPPPCAMRR